MCLAPFADPDRRQRLPDDEGYRSEFIVLAERASLLRDRNGPMQSRR